MVYSQQIGRSLLILGLLGGRAVPSLGGGGPQNVLVVVNDNSTNSIFLGKEYARQREIPERNVLRIATTVTNNIDAASFSNQIRAPIHAYLTEAGLEDQIDYLVLSRDIPFRIVVGPFTDYRHASVTATLFDDLYTSPNAQFGCNLAAGSQNDYAGSDMSFARPETPSQPHYRITSLLTARTEPQNLALIDRSTGVDFTRPPAVVYFEYGEDIFRNGRAVQYEDAAFSMLLRTNRAVEVSFPDGYGDGSPRTNAVGVTTGLRVYPRFTNTTFSAGCFAEHLTSFGGFLWNVNEGQGGLFDPWQMSILSWIAFGASASYGTVVEPCAYPQKFPAARMYDRYTRGFSMGESLYLSVTNPYQGVLVGDPLMQPYATPPTITVGGITNQSVVSGLVSMVVTAVPPTTAGLADRIDLVIDGRFNQTVVQSQPEPGNRVTVSVDGATRSYTVGAGEDLTDVAAGVASSINAFPLLDVRAEAVGDRVIVRQKNPGISAAGLNLGVSVSQHTATALTVRAVATSTNLVESPFPAATEIRLFGTTSSGDVVRLTVTRLDAMVVTAEVTAVTGDTANTLLIKLMEEVNTHPDLTNSHGVRLARYKQSPYGANTPTGSCQVLARTVGWSGYAPSVSISEISSGLGVAGGGLLDDNAANLTAWGLIELSAGRDPLVAGVNLDTTTLPDGPVELRLVGYTGDGPGTQGAATFTLEIRNHDLTCAITNLPAVRQAIEGDPVPVEGLAEFSTGSLTGLLLYVEGKPYAWTNTAAFSFVVDSGEFGIGNASIQAQAYLDNGQTTLSDPIQLEVRTASQFTSLAPTNGTITTVTNTLSLAATVNSGFPVTNITIASGPGVITGSDLTFTGPGPVELVFQESGDRYWSAVASTSTITVLDVLSFSVASDFGTVSPSPGSYELVEGTVLTNTLTSPVITAGQTQWVAQGWSLAGNDPETGSTTQFVMTVTNDAALNWHWSTNYWLTTTPGANGTIDPVSGWQPYGTTVVISALAELYYAFDGWSGDLSGWVNPESLIMTQPRLVGAAFTANLTTNTGTPEWWLASFGLTNDFPTEAMADQDGDFVPAWEEYLAGTVPTNGQSWLGLSGWAPSPGGVAVFWRSETGRVYDLEVNTGFTGPVWSAVATNLAATPPTNSVTPPGEGLNDMFRVRTRIAAEP
ncbi:MAG: TIGR03790 family protein [Kiritimatiellae bacterium]|nr:TIGR03790 family protein [Kiritimatiellia bacterium]